MAVVRKYKWELFSAYLLFLFSGSSVSWWMATEHDVAGTFFMSGMTTIFVALFGTMLIIALTE